MEPVILGEIGACMHVLLLSLCVNVGSKLRKTPETWLLGCAGRMCLGELTIGLNLACLVAVPCGLAAGFSLWPLAGLLPCEPEVSP